MSRFTIQHGEHEYAYGWDHVLGFFFDKTKEVKGKEINEFDVSEFINFIPHPAFPVQRPGRSVKLKQIVEIIEYEIEENGLQFPDHHLENIKNGTII